jgi:hypothetical protein
MAALALLRGRTLYHAGMARAGHVLGSAVPGDVAAKAMTDEKGNYLPNLVLYPGMQALRC